LRIIFVCKRYYTGKDVVLHRFGRLYEIPTQLASLGHQVTVLCLDYQNYNSQEDFTERFGSGSARWMIVCTRSIFNLKALAVYRAIKAMQPELVLGSSDIPCLSLTRWLAKRFGVVYAVDLYDNYESFGQARIPGFRRMLKESIRNAGVVIAVSSVLKAKVSDDYAPRGPVVVMNNGIEQSNFFSGARAPARKSLGLPLNVRLIGTAGNLSRMKGLDTVYHAWKALEGYAEDVYLVLAGRAEPDFPVPNGDRVIYLGELLEEQVGQLFRALDVGIIPAHDSEFGRYCFPQKLFEMVACGVPIVAARVGSIAQTFGANPEVLFTPGDVESLVAAVLRQLEKPYLGDIKPMEWRALVESVEPAILNLAESPRPDFR